MALHGEIKVNNKVILGWSAVRKEMVAESDLGITYRYACTIFPYRASSYRFDVEHRYEDGAQKLACKVLGGSEGWL